MSPNIDLIHVFSKLLLLHIFYFIHFIYLPSSSGFYLEYSSLLNQNCEGFAIFFNHYLSFIYSQSANISPIEVVVFLFLLFHQNVFLKVLYASSGSIIGFSDLCIAKLISQTVSFSLKWQLQYLCMLSHSSPVLE